MCLIFLSVHQHPVYKLMIAANRDEFYNRKTAPAAFWQDHPDIVAGRDLEAGGTWLGMTRSGRVSLLTNYRDPKNIDPNAPSRGHLVSHFLANGQTPAQYLGEIAPQSKRYNGFNLVVGTVDELWYHSNYQGEVQKLPPGFYGLSNHLLDTPWPKVEHGKELLKPLLASEHVSVEAVFAALYNDQRAADDQLPDTGIGLERERALSSMFIKTPNYGSRCSTVILVNHRNQVLFSERVYDLATFQHNTQTFEFALNT